MAGDQAFVIMQVGDKGSIDRKRADELFQYVITPVLDEIGIKPYRSDLDPTPGQINPQMLQRLLEARVIIADLTGRNPNVFYEFGIAHSFARPIIPLVDNVQSLPFDAHDERVIVLGEYREALSVPQAEEANAAFLKCGGEHRRRNPRPPRAGTGGPVGRNLPSLPHRIGLRAAIAFRIGRVVLPEQGGGNG